MNKFLTWFDDNRKKIGYTIGSLNVVTGTAVLSSGKIIDGIFWIMIGLLIIFDAKTFK
jgi:hypothetical protein